eukprot:Hpha_TRINITY_DN16417_c8_g2::TRINITY_DN16417_c8_g2_i1::g.164052::m.164052
MLRASALLVHSVVFVAGCGNVKLALTSTGSNSNCPVSAVNFHYWPLGDTTACHGWRATDNNGELHDNSANNIRCSADAASLLYDQYAGSLDCTGTATSKSFVLGECHQGVPPMLYDTAVNLDCCSQPDGASCSSNYTGVPRAGGAGTSDESVYWNGVLCEATSPPTASDQQSQTGGPTASGQSTAAPTQGQTQAQTAAPSTAPPGIMATTAPSSATPSPDPSASIRASALVAVQLVLVVFAY